MEKLVNWLSLYDKDLKIRRFEINGWDPVKEDWVNGIVVSKEASLGELLSKLAQLEVDIVTWKILWHIG